MPSHCNCGMYIHLEPETLHTITQTIFKTFAECGMQYKGVFGWDLTDEQKLKYGIPEKAPYIVPFPAEITMDELTAFGKRQAGQKILEGDIMFSVSVCFHYNFEIPSVERDDFPAEGFNDEEKEVVLLYEYHYDEKFGTRLCIFFYCWDEFILTFGNEPDALYRNNKKIVDLLESLFINTNAYFGYLARDLEWKHDISYGNLFGNSIRDHVERKPYLPWNEIVLFGKELVPYFNRQFTNPAKTVYKKTANDGIIMQQLDQGIEKRLI